MDNLVTQRKQWEIILGLKLEQLTFKRVSETCRSRQICTDLSDLADGLNGSIGICKLRTQDICKQCSKLVKVVTRRRAGYL